MYINNDNKRIDNTPECLYHGSKIKIGYLEPRKANGVGVESDKLTALYASHIKNAAIAFALPILPNNNGNRDISISFSEDWVPKITINAGWFDKKSEGYLYKLPLSTFEKLDNWQWISYSNVKPIAYEIIHAKEYMHWINYKL